VAAESSFLVRPARQEDLARVAAIESEVFTDAWSEQMLRRALSRGDPFLVVEGREAGPVGYALAVSAGGEGEILNIAIGPGYRRSGLGRRLLAALMNELRMGGVARVFLEVRASNQAAIHLYQAAGFHTVGLRRNYYRDPDEDAVTMAWVGTAVVQ
jgi:ribosomal-protein-alanine N-acetyltransferase